MLIEVGVNCGNGMQETGEGCDDGNLTSNDGCSAICQNEGCTNPTAYNYDAGAIIEDGSCEYCGDGVIQGVKVRHAMTATSIMVIAVHQIVLFQQISLAHSIEVAISVNEFLLDYLISELLSDSRSLNNLNLRP